MGVCNIGPEEFREPFQKLLNSFQGDINAETVAEAWNELGVEFDWNDFLTHFWKDCGTCRHERVMTEKELDTTPACKVCDDMTHNAVHWKGWQVAYDSLLKLKKMDLKEKKVLLMFVIQSLKDEEVPLYGSLQAVYDWSKTKEE